MKKSLVLVFLAILIFVLPVNKKSQPSPNNCNNKYLTLINPVRGRNLWSDKSLTPLVEQHKASFKYKFPSTWLFQHDALSDSELINSYKKLEIKGEAGVLLEVSKGLASKSGVLYRENVKWSDPGNVFLSSYKQSDRRKLIDTLYSLYKKEFGSYPESVGAWWIDSYSLNYIQNKYGLKSVLIVADQKTTDSYGVWGQWWGLPYIPTTYNILIPEKSRFKGPVVLQWAQRDPVLAYGEGATFSNFSLQANDYIRSGKNTDYFSGLSELYLDCNLPIRQLTVGMETGMEATDFHGEYINQLKILSNIKDLKVVTMSEFTDIYKKQNINNKNSVIGGFVNSKDSRINNYFGETINYSEFGSFGDYFMADQKPFLNRRLTDLNNKNKNPKNWLLYFSVVTALLYSYKKKSLVFWITHLVFVYSAYTLIYKSGYMNGWQVMYIKHPPQIYLLQILLYLTTFLLGLYVYFRNIAKFKNKNLLLAALPLSFAADGFINLLRYSKIDGSLFMGIYINNYLVPGLLFKDSNILFSNGWFEPLVIGNFLKFPIETLYSNLNYYLIANPIVHIVVAFLIYKVAVKFKKRKAWIFIGVLVIFYLIYINIVMSLDPLKIETIK